MIEQQRQQFLLHPNPLGMTARSREAQRSAIRAVDMRRRVHLSARDEQYCPNLDHIRQAFRCPVALHAVCRHIVQQCCAMFPAGTRQRQPRFCVQQPLKRPRISAHDSVRRRFKSAVGRGRILKRIQKLYKSGPALKSMRPRNYKLRINQHALATVPAQPTPSIASHFLDP